MGDELVCPECRDYLQHPTCCVCGWRKHPPLQMPGRKFCVAKNAEGEYCKNIPTQTVGRDWYCAYHADQKIFEGGQRAAAPIANKALSEIYAILGKHGKAREALERPVA